MKLHGFSKKELLDIYYQMSLSRYLDDKQLILLKQGALSVLAYHIQIQGNKLILKSN